MKTYELRIYQVAPGKMVVLQGIFQELVIPMLPEYAIISIGYLSTLDGSTLYYLVSHESLEVMDANWERFHANPRWKPGLTARGQGQTIVTSTQSVPLVGIPGLPPLNIASNLTD